MFKRSRPTGQTLPDEDGLTVVWEPEFGLTTLDVVFVHGFTGSPYKTWTQSLGQATRPKEKAADEPPAKVRKLVFPFTSRTRTKETAVDVFWPRDLLPLTLPYARVLTYGYDTRLKPIGRLARDTSLYDIAKDLLQSLSTREESGRPILFVCHSLGGIVAKEMLRQACYKREPRLRSVFTSTAGLMFFGTPHLGADPRSLVIKFVEKLARLFVQVNKRMVETLLPGSDRLRQLRAEFDPIARDQKWIIYSFQEADGVMLLGGSRVVDSASSYLNHDAALETTQLINRNHMEMCRFTHREDSEYQKVAAALLRMDANLKVISRPVELDGHVLRLTEDQRKIFFDFVTMFADIRLVPRHISLDRDLRRLTDDQRKTLLDSLRFRQINSRLITIRRPYASTLRWFFEEQTYLDWLDPSKLADHHGFLRIRALPGAGKSTLMKFAYDKAKNQGYGTIFFSFNAGGELLERSAIGMYRSLLVQLLYQRKELWTAFDAAGLEPWNAGIRYDWSLETLERLFEQVVLGLGKNESLTCFIDALDECSKIEVLHMANFLEDLGADAFAKGIQLRILFSSRSYLNITTPRGGLDLELDKQEGHSDDIRKYIEGKLSLKLNDAAQEEAGQFSETLSDALTSMLELAASKQSSGLPIRSRQTERIEQPEFMSLDPEIYDA